MRVGRLLRICTGHQTTHAFTNPLKPIVLCLQYSNHTSGARAPSSTSLFGGMAADKLVRSVCQPLHSDWDGLFNDNFRGADALAISIFHGQHMLQVLLTSSQIRSTSLFSLTAPSLATYALKCGGKGIVCQSRYDRFHGCLQILNAPHRAPTNCPCPSQQMRTIQRYGRDSSQRNTVVAHCMRSAPIYS